jgi:hypothetical protein
LFEKKNVERKINEKCSVWMFLGKSKWNYYLGQWVYLFFGNTPATVEAGVKQQVTLEI